MGFGMIPRKKKVLPEIQVDYPMPPMSSYNTMRKENIRKQLNSFVVEKSAMILVGLISRMNGQAPSESIGLAVDLAEKLRDELIKREYISES